MKRVAPVGEQPIEKLEIEEDEKIALQLRGGEGGEVAHGTAHRLERVVVDGGEHLERVERVADLLVLEEDVAALRPLLEDVTQMLRHDFHGVLHTTKIGLGAERVKK